MTVTKPQAEMIASLAVAARPHGARRWDTAGVMAALGKVRGLELADVMMAAGRAARDRSLDTPAAIGNTAAPCWVERPVERFVPEKTTAEDRCGVCGKGRGACENGPRFADDEHRFEPDIKVRNGTAVDELRDIKAKAVHGDPTTRHAEQTEPDVRDQSNESEE